MRTSTLALALTLLIAAAGTAAAQRTFQLDVALHELESGGLHVAPDAINAAVGDTLQLTVTNSGKSPHNLVFCGDEACSDKWGFTPLLDAGASAPLHVVAKKAGTFVYFCDIPGHKPAGMRGTLSVAGGQEKAAPTLALVGTLMSLAAVALLLRRR